MSKSRLEKFLYALYSLDSSDLPNPLSRIEELYKCLVTGDEAPTFEPLSRVEKYLMAILGAYDADELPNPISRVEVLLYKLATGDDNLDDVKSFLSEHEELLAEIIRNGGVGGNIDIEYILYTLSTEHGTLYNTAKKPVKSAILKGRTLVNVSGEPIVNLVINSGTPKYLSKHILKKDTTYTFIYDIEEVTGDASGCWGRFTYTDGSYKNVLDKAYTTGITKVVTSFDRDDLHNIYIGFIRKHVVGQSVKFKSVMILEGDWTGKEIPPYFEGMQSVKMPVLTTSNEDGTKTNILSCNEDVTLRGIGVGSNRVEDELDCLTGKVTERIREVTLNGSEEWSINNSDNEGFFSCSTTTYVGAPSGKVICEQLPSVTTKTEGVMMGVTTGKLLVTFNRDKTGVTSLKTFKAKLAELQLKVCYEIENTIKTVDLSVVDQDGNDTELSTFNDITHVTLSSEGLIPEAELEVATKNEEVLNTMSLEMDDISTTQNALQETSNAQSENVDSTMIATTEIYEGLL